MADATGHTQQAGTTARVDEAVIQAAIAALDKTYSPYSNFPVGCAVRDELGQIHVGVNVENAAYPVGTCAEAGAIAAMITNGGHRITVLAVAGCGEGLTTPCGACRQRIREFASGTVPVYVCGPEGLRQSFSVAELLPSSFGPANLA